jgi:hypothetical protein
MSNPDSPIDPKKKPTHRSQAMTWALKTQRMARS